MVSNSFRPYGLWPTRLLFPWDSPGKNTGMGCHALIQEIFPSQRLNLHLSCLLHWKVGSWLTARVIFLKQPLQIMKLLCLLSHSNAQLTAKTNKQTKNSPNASASHSLPIYLSSDFPKHLIHCIFQRRLCLNYLLAVTHVDSNSQNTFSCGLVK